jgi:PhnB protein
MKLNAYLNFDGRCREAFEFYQKVLGGEIVMMLTHADTPAAAHTAPEWQDKIMHARLITGDNVLMGSDAPGEYFDKPQGFSVSIVLGDVAEGEQIFNALAEGGSVGMPFDKTFWSAGFGMAVDRFGIPWMVNCEGPA